MSFARPASPKVVTTQPGAVKRLPRLPVRVVCYICGREAGTHSIRFHHEKCAKRTLAAGNQLPLPPEPALLGHLPSSDGAALREYNRQAREVFRAHAYRDCKYCGLSVLQSAVALKVHHRDCQGIKARLGLTQKSPRSPPVAAQRVSSSSDARRFDDDDDDDYTRTAAATPAPRKIAGHQRDRSQLGVLSAF